MVLLNYLQANASAHLQKDIGQMAPEISPVGFSVQDSSHHEFRNICQKIINIFMSIIEQVQGRSLEGTFRSTALGVCLNLSFEKTELQLIDIYMYTMSMSY